MLHQGDERKFPDQSGFCGICNILALGPEREEEVSQVLKPVE